MQSITIETKMSDLQVVQTVLDFWDPYSASIYRSSTLNQIDEYDSYSFPILELLRGNASFEDLRHFLIETELQKGRLSRDENYARNNFFAWALSQTWQRHASKETNIRRLHVDSVQLPDGDYRFVPRLELIQQYLQQWDPLRASKYWLFGADTLSQYDESSILLDQALEDRDVSDVCLALELACWKKDDGIAFALENYALEQSLMQERYNIHLVNRSTRHMKDAEHLMKLFSQTSRTVRRRIKPR